MKLFLSISTVMLLACSSTLGASSSPTSSSTQAAVNQQPTIHLVHTDTTVRQYPTGTANPFAQGSPTAQQMLKVNFDRQEDLLSQILDEGQALKEVKPAVLKLTSWANDVQEVFFGKSEQEGAPASKGLITQVQTHETQLDQCFQQARQTNNALSDLSHKFFAERRRHTRDVGIIAGVGGAALVALTSAVVYMHQQQMARIAQLRAAIRALINKQQPVVLDY
jgi:hypothetical protein